MKKLGYLCEACGALTPNRDAICDDCFTSHLADQGFERAMAAENARFERLEWIKLCLSVALLSFGFLFLLLALYWRFG